MTKRDYLEVKRELLRARVPAIISKECGSRVGKVCEDRNTYGEAETEKNGFVGNEVGNRQVNANMRRGVFGV